MCGGWRGGREFGGLGDEADILFGKDVVDLEAIMSRTVVAVKSIVASAVETNYMGKLAKSKYNMTPIPKQYSDGQMKRNLE